VIRKRNATGKKLSCSISAIEFVSVQSNFFFPGKEEFIAIL
jgi:hypothetical protein